MKTSGSGMPWLVGAALLLAYVATTARGMVLGDGCEFAAAAYVLGVPHPTGYPLYMLLLKAFSFLPLGDVIRRTSLASAVAMAFTAGLTGVMLRDLLHAVLPRWRQAALVAAAAGGALSLGLLYEFWSNAVVTEVYALELALMVAFMRAAQLFLLRREARPFVLATLLLGLGLAHHRLSVCLLPPYLALTWSALRRDGVARWRRTFLGAAGVLAACLCLYAYLPLRAAASKPINWGDPGTAAAFVNHIRGGDYLKDRMLRALPGRRLTPATYASFAFGRSVQLANDFAAQFAPFRSASLSDGVTGSGYRRPFFAGTLIFAALALLGGYGLVRLGRVARALTATGALVVAGNLCVVFVYNIPDIRDYCLFPFWFGWLAVYAGLVALLDRASSRLAAPAGATRPRVAFLLLLLPAALAVVNWPRCDASADSAAEEYSSLILPQSRETMPAGSVLITGGDGDTFTCWYRQIVRSERTDVLVVAANFLQYPWYRRFFRPERLERYRLGFYEGRPRGAEAYAQRIVNGIIEPNRLRYPVFTSITDPPVLRLLGQRYTLRQVARTTLPPRRPTDAGDPVHLLRIERRLDPVAD